MIESLAMEEARRGHGEVDGPWDEAGTGIDAADGQPGARTSVAGRELGGSRDRSLTVAVVGGGLVAQAVHIPLLTALPGFELVAIAEPSRRLREAVASRWRIPTAHDDHRRALEGQRPDALVVCSPNGTHAHVVLDAIAAGVHVLVEKPLCLDPADADRIDAAARDAGVVVQVGYMKRHDPAVERLLAQLRRDGGLRHLSALTHDPGMRRHFMPAGMPEPDDIPARVREALARDTARQVAAALGSEDPALVRPFSETFLGALVHDVNLGHAVLDAAGDAVERLADAFWHPDGSRAGGTLELRSGARWTLAWLLMEAVTDFRQELTVLADRAIHALAFPAPYVLHAPTQHERRAGEERRTFASWAEAYARQLEHFRACIAGEETCRTPPAEARRDQALLTELFAAAIEAGAPA